MTKITPKKIYIVTLILIINLIILNTRSYAEEQVEKNVYVVIINRLTLNDLSYIKTLDKLCKDGSIGLMNTRGSNGYYGADGYITLNTSSRAWASNNTSLFVNLDKSNNKIVYKRRTGRNSNNFQIGNLNINKLLEANKDEKYSPYIGALGDTLHKYRHKTAVFGNSDTADTFVRTNCLIAMDSKGLIDFGNVDTILIEDNTYPFGIKTDFSKIIKEIKEIRKKASLIVIETGDLNRLEFYENNLSYDMYLYHRTRILKDIDNFLKDLIKIIKKENSLMIFISPNSPNTKLKEGNKLTPIIFFGQGIKKGLLYSDTTRRKGIVANIDIAPTISNYLGINSSLYSGNPIKIIKDDNNKAYIDFLNRITKFVSKIRPQTLNIYSIFTIIILIISATIMFYYKYFKSRIKKISLLLLIVITIPIVLHIVSIFRHYTINKFIIYTMVLFLVIFSAILLIKDKYRLVFVLGVTYFTILLDILLNSKLTKYSVFGYDPIIGARYFGIGNELVGVLLPTGIIFLGLIIDKIKRKYFILLISILTILVVAHPNLGANFGGTITIAFANFCFLIKIQEKSLNYRNLFLTISLIFFIILLMGGIDLTINPNPTHLGKALSLLINKGPFALTNIVSRKLNMNIKLIGTSIWTKVIFTNIIILSIMLIYLNNILKEMINNNKFFSYSIISGIIGSLAGFLMNDSGILLAAIASLYISTSVMYVTIGYVVKRCTKEVGK
ncbi:hypothetical protein [Thermohalobacter berrensis]|uniref:Uncharacterized protein n=1 Tax=Thermohalobacter berrensis TaxID=99594 RepID=A0A419TAX5_9FIRM|nr:hypothetical protein [Thermohalobacter berrensis]RKD34615.1 hypothetical protein BET03_01965 [Thermohalobacter berrensis]